jgi:hypothetical protein
MEDDRGGVVSKEIDEVTEKTDTRITRKHATIDWLSGYSEGERRGIADALDALASVLRLVGISEEESESITQKILERSGRIFLFR